MQGSYLNGYNQMKQYIVKSGDSLYSIAKTFNTTVDELKSINHLYSNTIYPNQILFIPNSFASKHIASTPFTLFNFPSNETSPINIVCANLFVSIFGILFVAIWRAIPHN